MFFDWYFLCGAHLSATGMILTQVFRDRIVTECLVYLISELVLVISELQSTSTLMALQTVFKNMYWWQQEHEETQYMLCGIKVPVCMFMYMAWIGIELTCVPWVHTNSDKFGCICPNSDIYSITSVSQLVILGYLCSHWREIGTFTTWFILFLSGCLKQAGWIAL